MKKISAFLLCNILLLSISLTSYAQEQYTIINNGYTSNGIYYTVYELDTLLNSERVVGDKITVTREFQFSGIIQPSSEQNYTEYVNGVCYTGILTLYAFTYENGNTLAVYKGTLTAIN